MTDVTELLMRARSTDSDAFAKVYEVLFRELQTVARAQLRRHKHQTLNTIALINESYIKLVDNRRLDVTGRAHFLALAARAMRQILIDYHRKQSADKRGGYMKPVTLLEDNVAGNQRGDALLALDESIVRLQSHDERLARVVECRFFGGMSYEEIGESLGIAARTARLDWRKAKAWLTLDLSETGQSGTRTGP